MVSVNSPVTPSPASDSFSHLKCTHSLDVGLSSSQSQAEALCWTQWQLLCLAVRVVSSDARPLRAIWCSRWGSADATFQSDSRQVTSHRNQRSLCNERIKYQTVFFSTRQKLNNLFLQPFILYIIYLDGLLQIFLFSVVHTKIARTRYTYQSALCIKCCWVATGAHDDDEEVFLSVHVISREALTAHKERVHGGHFGSNKRMYTVEDGC